MVLSPAHARLEVKSLNALDVESSLSMNSTIVYIEDEDDALTFQDIHSGRFTDPLQQQAGRIFNIGISDSTYWFFFKLNHFSAASDKAVERLIEIPYPPLDRIDVFTLNLNTNELQTYKSGDSLYFNERPIANNNHLFSVKLDHNEEVFVAIRVKSKGSLRIPIVLWEPSEFYEHSQTTTLFMGLYFGIMFLMFFYNACIYVATKDSSYLKYITYIGALALFQALMTGYAGEYLWPNTPIMNDKMLNATVLAICCSGILFVRTLLDLKTRMPDVDRTLSRIIQFNAWLIPVTFFLPYVATLKYAIAIAILTAGFCLFLGTKLALNGVRTAKFFILAWFCLLVGALIMGAVSAGLIPANVFTTNALLVGSAIEASLLSLTLADQMNRVQRERAIAQRKAKRALEKANQVLTESNRTKDEFLATISHELRTPMNGVLTCLSHLYDEHEPVKQRNFLGLAEKSANHMMLLVDGVLSYAELQSKQFVLNKALFHTSWLTDELNGQYQQLCADKGIEFTTEIKSEVPEYLFGDSAKLLQVLSNLTDNAVKFTESGFVKVSLDIDAINKKQQTVDLVFTVQDSGIGIPEGSEEIIFSKFKQLDGSNTRSHGGLGIGLTVCREIASHMHADLNYSSTVGKGSKFTLTISLKYSMQPNHEEELIARQKYPLEELTKDKLALVVEDNPVNAMILKALLEKIGLTTKMASNGLKGLEMVKEEPIDIVLMDCQMPEMDGLEATKEIRNLEGEKALIPIIAVTANATSVDRNKCIQAGMNDYLSKPLNKQELLEKLTQWLPLDHTQAESIETTNNVTHLRPKS
ncbi:MAG: response regulator [Pseudomonadales bacterium]|nr:response regulator [Pseudomonadales bacterium]